MAELCGWWIVYFEEYFKLDGRREPVFFFVLGMDPKNEKIVFNMIVDMLSKDNDLMKTQYFM